MMRGFVALAVAVAAGAVVALAGPTTILVAVEAGLVTAPLVARFVRHRLDVFEPITWANAALFLMFVIHPVAHWAYDSYSFRGYDVKQALDAGLVVAVAGTAAIQLGYAIPAGRTIAAWLPSAPTELHRPGAASAYALGITALGIAGFVAFPSVSQGASAYLYYLPMLVIPGALLLLAIGLRVGSASAVLLALFGVTAGFMVFGPSGQRAWLLVLLAPTLVYGVYLRRGARPGLLPLMMMLLITFPFLAAARDLSPGESLADLVGAVGQAVIATPQTIREFVLGPDTEMLDGLAMEVQAVPRDLPFHPGNSLASLVAQPIPRALWPDKPRQADDLVNEYLFGSVGYVVGNSGVAFSLFGGLYFDVGLPSVLLGGLACGVLLRLPWEWYRRHAASPIAALQLAATLPFVVILMRGNMQDTLSRALFVIAPILLLGVVSKRVRHRVGARRSVP
jgi:hypothetical protein